MAWFTPANKDNRACPQLKELVDEFREVGKYVFRNNKNRLKVYSSGY